MGENVGLNATGGSTPARNVSQPQMNLLEQLLGVAGKGVSGIPSQFTSGWPEWTEMPPGLNNLQSMSLAGLENIAAGGESGMGGTTGAANQALRGILTSGPTEFDDFFKTNVQDPLLEAFTETMAPARKRAGVGHGALFSRGVEDNISRDFEDMMDAMVKERASSALNFRYMDIANKLAAAGLAPDVELGSLGRLFGMGEEARQVEREGFTTRLGEFLRQIEEARSRIGTAGTLATATTKGATRGYGSWLEGFAGVANAAANMTGSIMGTCWVAAAHYGWFTPEWFAAARFVNYIWPERSLLGRLWLRIYMKYGERLATLVGKSRIVRAITKPMFDWFVREGR